jgi:uncharacterized protein with von Willebrand factor type A (vWA) domain
LKVSEGATAAGEAVVARLGELGAAFRSQGGRAGVGELVASVRALACVDSASREDARLALRAVLCSTRSDIERFEMAFGAVFGDARLQAADPLQQLGGIERAALPRVAFPASGRSAVPGQRELVPSAWSQVELLRRKDFAHYSEEEVAIARELIARLARRGPMRISRRTRVARRRSHAPDLRRIVRASLRTGGEPLERTWRAPSLRARQLVLVCDISGSMAPYARMLLQYLQACVTARRRVEAFAFGTRLTRITQELAGRDPDRALERASGAVLDIAGGTRIGAALAELNRAHGRRLGRGALVVILSDGWDRGDPELLAAEMARLRRTAHRLVWLNPLAAHPTYEPLTRGMVAAIPHTDRLLPGNSLASLEELAAMLEEMR